MRSGRSALVSVLVCAASAGPARAEPPSVTPAATPPATEARAPEVPRAALERSSMPLTSRLARDTVARALEVAGHPGARRGLASLSSRVRTAALLPQLTVRALRTTDQALRLSPTLDEPDRYSESGGAGLWLEARLTWQLDRLVY